MLRTRDNTRIAKLGLGALAALAFAACQTTLTLNTENLQNLIAQGIEQQNTGVSVTSVTCPERPIQQGDRFECTAVTSAGNYRVSVTQTDATGHVDWEITGQI